MVEVVGVVITASGDGVTLVVHPPSASAPSNTIVRTTPVRAARERADDRTPVSGGTPSTICR